MTNPKIIDKFPNGREFSKETLTAYINSNISDSNNIISSFIATYNCTTDTIPLFVQFKEYHRYYEQSEWKLLISMAEGQANYKCFHITIYNLEETFSRT